MPKDGDLVYTSRLEVELFPDHVKQTSRGPRGISITESWTRAKQLGSGGFGAVYLDKCVEVPDKVRAVKQLSKSKTVDYRRELEAAALFSQTKYEHCFVKSFGCESVENIFLTMEFLPLGDLQRYTGSAYPEAEARIIIAQVLEALNFMHERDYTHRDIKPANVLVCAKGPQWWVKLADFGISKRAAKGISKLRTQVFTPEFVAPEVLFVSEHYTNAVDMWSTGVLAFLLLSGTLPFETFPDLVRYWTSQSDFRSRDMLAIDISGDAHHFLGSLINCKPGSRLPARVSLYHEWIKQTESAAPKLKSPGQAVEAIHDSMADPQARVPLYQKHNLDAQRILRVSYSANSITVAVDVGNVVRLLDTSTGTYNDLPLAEEDDVLRLAFSSVGDILATQGRSKGITLWNLDNGFSVTILAETNTLGSILFSPDGSLIALWVFHTPGFRIFKTATGEEVRFPPGPQKSMAHLAFSPRSDRLAVQFLDGRVGVFSLPVPELIAELDSPANQTLKSVLRVAYTKTGYIVAAHDNNTIDIWNTTHRPFMRLGAPQPSRKPYQFAISPDGQTLARESSQGAQLEIWDLTSGSHTHSIHHKLLARPKELEFSASGQSLVYSTGFPNPSQVTVWHVASGDCLYEHMNSDQHPAKFALSNNGKLAVAHNDGVVEIIDLEGLEKGHVRPPARNG